jgi:hypothetical protein
MCRVLFSIRELQDQFNSFLSMCGLLFKAEVLSKVDTFFASGQLLNALKTGDILPYQHCGKYRNSS